MAKIKFEKYFKHVSYSYTDILSQIWKAQKRFDVACLPPQKDVFTVFIKLQPREGSIVYKVKFCCNVGSSKVHIYIVDPEIKRSINGHKVPHMYSDTSLCLYYPKWKEWTIENDWADTLIPWTSLWLFYFEIWMETGEWLGGGKHPSKGRGDIMYNSIL